MTITFCFVAALFFTGEVIASCPSTVNFTEILDGYRYTRVQSQFTFEQASFHCNRKHDGGYLAHIRTEIVSQLVGRIISGCDDIFRIGLELQTGNGWYWSDTYVFDYIPSQPLLDGQSRWNTEIDVINEDAINNTACVIPEDGAWIRVKKSQLYPYICETNLLVITPEMEDLFVNVGETVTINIYIESIDGIANISLYKDRNYDVTIDASSIQSGWWSHEIPSVTENDAGLYEIIAMCDDYKRIASKLVIVQEPVTIVSKIPSKVSYPVTRGPRSIECAAKGIPTPTTMWERNSVTVGNDSTVPGVYQTYRGNSSWLNIENANSIDHGVYVCVAKNNIGVYNNEVTDRKETTLRIFGRPTVLGVETNNCTEDALQICLAWNANDRTTGINHIIQIRSKLVFYDQLNVTATDQSVIYTYVLLPLIRDINITVTVCPDDCIAVLSDKTLYSVTPNRVTDLSVTKGDRNITRSCCQVRWFWTDPTSADGLVIFKIRQTSVTVNARDSYNVFPTSKTVLVPAIDGYVYETDVEPNTDNTFDVFVSLCDAESVEVRAKGECKAGSAAPYEIRKPIDAESERDSDVTHSIVVTVPNEKNGLISCLFVVVRRGGGIVGRIDMRKLRKLSGNGADDSTSADGNEYIALSSPMYDAIDDENKTVTLGENKTSTCDIYEISRLGRHDRERETTDAFMGFNWALKFGLNYSVSVVSTTPDESNEILIAQSETFTFRHKRRDVSTESYSTTTSERVVHLSVLGWAINFGCFSKSSYVTRPDRTRVPMSKVQIGDTVLTLNSGGKVVTDKVIAFLHWTNSKKRTSGHSFKKITTIDGRSITLTTDHLIKVLPAESATVANSSYGFVFAYAKNLKPGDFLLGLNSSTSSADSDVTLHRVDSVELLVLYTAVYAPLTSSGTLLVNGMLASCYSVIENHALMHIIVSPIRYFYIVKNWLFEFDL